MFKYVLIDSKGKRRSFMAQNDRAAKGKARRMLGRVHSTYYLSDEWDNMKPVQAWCLQARQNCETAALYCDCEGAG
jgi:hypothetical protein